jgi:hypothetical protein
LLMWWLCPIDRFHYTKNLINLVNDNDDDDAVVYRK